MSKKKFFILDYLRAISALLVCYGHIITFDVGGEPFLKDIANFITYIEQDTVYALVLGKYINLGEIGVSMFFLLSGFLIMRSRDIHSTRKYIILRVFRIYPVAIMTTFICFFSVISVNNYFLNLSYIASLSDVFPVIVNALILYDFFPVYIVVPVFWSLLVEVKFYALMSIAKNFKQKELFSLSLIMLLIVMCNTVFLQNIVDSGYLFFSRMLLALAFCAAHILFMLIGSSLYFIFKDYVYNQTRLIVTSDILYTVGIYLLFILGHTTYMHGVHTLPPDLVKNYTISLVVFICALAFIHKVSLDIPFLRFCSKITYPLYTIHFTLGACLVFILSRLSFMTNHLIVMYFIVFSGVFFGAYAIHRFIEKPGMRVGSMLINMLETSSPLEKTRGISDSIN